MTSGNKSSTNFKLSDVVGQTASIIFSSKGYIINSGFLNSAAGSVFTFTVSPSNIDFGNLIPDNPVERVVKLTISNGNSPGYIVKVTENQPLSTSLDAQIPDTTCDKMKPCTISKSGEWFNNNTYGFGYTINGNTVPQDIIKPNYYKPFPATRRNDQADVIMKSQAKKVTDMASMTLKVNIQKEQPVGQYKNILIFSAISGI
jgi:hypothetical protein